MLVWRTNFALLIPGRLPHEIESVAASRRIGWWTTGLRLKVSDGAVSARYNENSRISHAPLLRARLEVDPEGTHIVGRIQWTVLLGALWISGAATVCFAALAAVFVWERESFYGAWLAAVSAFWAILFITEVRFEQDLRDSEVERLRFELLRRLGRRAN